MSTPSDTIRTATIHGSLLSENRAMRSEAPGSSDTATTARVPSLRSSSAMPVACVWSIAITNPPASGCTWRNV